MIRVRYFAAARAAAGLEEEQFDAPAGTTLRALLQEAVDRPRQAGGGQPSLRSIIDRSSFLRNEIAVRDHAQELQDQDVIDVLPPFAGG